MNQTQPDIPITARQSRNARLLPRSATRCPTCKEVGVKRRAKPGSGYRRSDGYIQVATGVTSKHTLAHIAAAEKAMGKPLPAGAIVHHVNEQKDDNRNENLVICPDDAYHQLLHKRMRALAACGNPNWRVCNYCHKYDDPANMYIKGR